MIDKTSILRNGTRIVARISNIGTIRKQVGIFGSATVMILLVSLAAGVVATAFLYSSNVIDKPPQLRITSLANDEVLPAGSIEVRGTAKAESGTIKAVSVRVDSGSPISVSPDSVNDYSGWTVSLPISDPGDHTIEVEAVDHVGKKSSTKISVMVADGAAILIAPPNQIIEATGPSGAIANYPVPTVDKNIRILNGPDCSPLSGKMFPIGTNTVTCAASFAGGNTAATDFTISIHDTTPPTIIAPLDITARNSGDALTKLSLGNPVVKDIVDPNPTVSNNAPSDGFTLGTTNVVWTAVDDYGNKGTAIQKVTVTAPGSTTGNSGNGGGGGGEGGSHGGSGGSGNNNQDRTDTIAPGVTASPAGGTFGASQSVKLSSDEPATIYYTTNGNAPTTSSPVYSSPITIASTTTLKYFAKDTDGNSGNVVTQIYSIDTTAPSVVITQPADNSVLTGTSGNILVTGTSSDADSHVKMIEVGVDNGSFIAAKPKAAGDWSTWTASLDKLSQGFHTIYARATDNAGNQRTTSIIVQYGVPDLSSQKMIFATVLPYVKLETQSDIYSPHMTATDDSKLHVGLNKGFTDAQLDMVKSLKGLHGVEFFSLAEIEKYAPTLKEKGFDYVSYDLEPGASYSPQNEIDDPVGSVIKASKIAHDNDLLMEVAPSRAITTQFGQQIAPYVDMYHIQSQALQGKPADFESYVKDISAKLKDANPNIKSITIQFSTNREAASGMTLQETMQHDWNLVSDHVGGATVWFSNNDSSLSMLRAFVDWFDANSR